MSNRRYSKELLQDKPGTHTCQQDDDRDEKSNLLILVGLQKAHAFSQYLTIDSSSGGQRNKLT
jgi:hypothetical protein